MIKININKSFLFFNQKQTLMKKQFLTLVLVLCSMLFLKGQIYVDTDATGANNGSSWDDAYVSLQDALAVAGWQDTIWVAEGTYYPDEGSGQTNNDRTSTFSITNQKVVVAGGFVGTETSLDQRDWMNNETILSGDLDQDGTTANNAYHVVYFYQSDTEPVLDGFTITDGYANGSGYNDMGGGIFIYSESTTCYPQIYNCIIENNEADVGGGVQNYAYNASADCTPTMVNCIIRGNIANFNGGGISNETVSGYALVKLTNGIISGNRAYSKGGGVRNYGNMGDAKVEFRNVTVVGNMASTGGGAGYGGGMYSEAFGGGYSYSDIINCIFWNNYADGSGNEIYNSGSSSSPYIGYSDIENSGGSASWDVYLGSDQGNNIDSEPNFVLETNYSNAPTTSGDLHVYNGSPCLDVGDNSANPETYDLEGNDRVQNSTIDLGAYEGGIANTYYVDMDASGNDDGSSWDDAFTTLQDALVIAASGDEIWVAEGTYYPDEGASQTDGDRNSKFQIPSGVKVYGGFSTYEASFSEREPNENIVTLSGDLNQDDETTGITDNAYHVVYFRNASSETILDGFTITAGNANGSDPRSNGGGILNDGSGSGNSSSPQIIDCKINNNYADYGGALYSDATDGGNTSSVIINCELNNNEATRGGALFGVGALSGTVEPIFTNCTFNNNYVSVRGGAIYIYGIQGGCAPEFIHCIISGNTAGDYGGAAQIKGQSTGGTCTAKFVNCAITGNIATNNYGGGLYINARLDGTNNSEFINCVISGNEATNGGGIYFDGADATPTITNSIIWNNNATTSGNQIYNSSANPTYSYCDIESSGGSASWDASLGADGGNNIDTDPLFVSEPDYVTAPTTTGDVHLYNGSPCLDAGNNSANTETEDLEGNSRIQNTTIDLGPYEGFIPNIIYVNADASGSNNGISWADAYNSLQDGLSSALGGDQIWVAAGSYYPDEGTGQTDGDRASTFNIPDSVKVYGGFAGNETGLNQRDYENNLTILSGDLNQDDETTGNTENAYNVVTFDNISDQTLIDGLTITAGNAASSYYGAGICNDAYTNGSSSPHIYNCKIVDNYGNDCGGGISNLVGENYISGMVLINCVISGNRGTYGGGFYNDVQQLNSSCNIQIINCLISGNKAANNGGGIMNVFGDGQVNPDIINTTITGNYADIGGGMSSMLFLGGGTCNPVFQNTIIWNNFAATQDNQVNNNSSTPSYSYCNIQGSGGSSSWDPGLGTDNGNNIDSDPIFVTPPDYNNAPTTEGDCHLYAGSPSLNTGDNSANSETTDIEGNDRVQYDVIDMGAHEGAMPHIFYVDADASDGGNGTSWATAYNKLQDALKDATIVEGDAIWVAAGTYYPDEGSSETNGDETSTFRITNGVAVYGGFEGNETGLSERDWNKNITILSGDLNQDDETTGITDNANKVVTFNEVNSQTMLDGFTVTSGNADGATTKGGGIYIVAQNVGTVSNPQINNCIITNNNADDWGGGIYNYAYARETNPVFTNCIIRGNNAGNDGGGVYNDVVNSAGSSYPVFMNCVFSGNYSGDYGGAVYNRGFYGTCIPEFINCTFAGNYAPNGAAGAMFNNGDNGTCEPQVVNCIMWNNGDFDMANKEVGNSNGATPVFSYCDIESSGGSNSWNTSYGTDMGDNLDADPLFLEETDYNNAPTNERDLKLSYDSPCINAGDNDAITLEYDLDDGDRILDNDVDVGAYEGGVYYLTSDGSWPASTQYDDVVIDSCTITISGTKELGQCNNLLIKSMGNLTINGDLNVDKDLTIESDTIGTGSLIDNGTLTVANNILVEQYLDTNSTDVNWHYLSIPVEAETADAFPGYYADPDTYYAYEWTEGSESWSGGEITDPSATLNPLTGYAVLSNGFVKAEFSGTLNKTELSKTNMTTSAGTTYEGYYLVGNPYPSAIDITQLSFTNLSGSAWFRTDGTFATVNMATGTGQNGATQYVPAMQGFWVKVNAGTTGDFTMPVAMKTHTTHDFYKDEENIFRMNILHNGMNDETVVGFYSNAEENYEACDSEKKFTMAGNVAEVYTIAEGYKLAINGLKAKEEANYTVPLGIKTYTDGECVLSATNIAEFNPAVDVYLVDKVLGITKDLRKEHSYSFTIQGPNVLEGRFELVFGSNPANIDESMNDQMSVYAHHKTIYIKSSVDGLAKIYVSDATGKSITATELFLNKGLNRFELYDVSQGFYLVNVVINDQPYTEKVVIN